MVCSKAVETSKTCSQELVEVWKWWKKNIFLTQNPATPKQDLCASSPDISKQGKTIDEKKTKQWQCMELHSLSYKTGTNKKELGTWIFKRQRVMEELVLIPLALLQQNALVRPDALLKRWQIKLQGCELLSLVAGWGGAGTAALRPQVLIIKIMLQHIPHG